MSMMKKTEEWLLTQVDAADPDVGAIAAKLSELSRGEGVEAVLTLAEFVEGALAEKGRNEDALRILRFRSDWMTSIDARKELATAVIRIIGNTPTHRAFLKNCGINGRVPVAECLDRMDRLRAMQEGMLCLDKTWGFGVIQHVDPFYEKVVVDFDRRKSHEMALSYAAESLELIDDRHILSVKHRDPDEIVRLVEEDPAEVVRMALRSYGPLNPVILQEKLSPALVAAENWKKFWDTARKALKSDPTAVVPTKRTDPILIKEAAEAYGEPWFRQLKSDRDIDSIMSKISDWQALNGGQDVDPMHLAVIENRMAFVVKGADLMGKTIKPRAMMLAHAVGHGVNERIGVVDYVKEVLASGKLLDLLGAMNAKDMKAFIAFLMDVDRAQTLDALLRELSRLDVTSLTEVLQLLMKEGAEDACRQAVKGLINARRAQVALLSWLSRNMDKLTAWDLCAPMEFAEVVLLEMEKDYTGLRLKAQNQLRDRFTQKTWVTDLFDRLGKEGRERYFLRLKDTSAWPTMEKRSVLGQIIKLYPELERLMTAKASDKEEAAKPRGLVTSARTYRERQLLYERIKMVDIPNNSKEIGHAREYGDLRENFEYKAAKEMQGILMRRQAELEQMLAKVMPTTFAGMVVGKAGIGTGVLIEYQDGRREQYYVLGVWDRDESLGIISCESKFAQALEGRSEGEDVTIPTEHGETTCRVVSVTVLPDEVRVWINDVPETLEGRNVVA